MRYRYILALLALAYLVGNAPAIIAEASGAPVVGCEVREPGHRAKHGGIADDIYHRERGEAVTCESQAERSLPTDEHRDDTDDGKSRHCRKHWYC